MTITITTRWRSLAALLLCAWASSLWGAAAPAVLTFQPAVVPVKPAMILPVALGSCKIDVIQCHVVTHALSCHAPIG